QPGRGAATLAQIATTSGGRERVELPEIWADLQSKPRFVEMSPWLLVLATILFLLEIFERRTGWIGRLILRKPAMVQNAEEETISAAPAGTRFWKRTISKPTRKGRTSVADGQTRSEKPETDAGGSVADSNLESLRKARERANRRTNRDS
ncbi:MAG: hypothetical protein H7Y43_03515, partial [Akkermansiaceae bacterium]|nr:hypothetical protein [Verrucomicrobiales bacterium]